MISLTETNLNRFWFFKYKIYHFFFWAFYHFAWGVANLSLLVTLQAMNTPRFIMFVFYVFIHTFAVYFNLYFLLPKFLEKGKLVQYIIYLFLWIGFTTFLLMVSYFLAAYLINKDLNYFCGFEADPSTREIFFFLITKALPTTAGAIILGMSIKLAKNWSQAKKRQQILEKEKLETELNFLKSQFNPHFLFNSINSIFFLIHKDPTMASTALAKFSELLRYQLYECNEEQISLSNEIAYLENFIMLEKLRKNKDFCVSFEVDPQNKGHLGIASFVLMTFVENAFKHASKHKDKPNWVRIKLSFDEEQQLHFEVINSKSEKDETTREAVHYGGIGLKNVKRRLALIYPEQYDLTIENLGDEFRVKLQLKLTELSGVQAASGFQVTKNVTANS